MTKAFLAAMIAALLLTVQLSVPSGFAGGALSAVAWADDDDDEGDDDDDDDDDGGSGSASRDDDDDDGGPRPRVRGSGGGLLRNLLGAERRPTPAPVAPAPPVAAPDEIVALTLSAADLDALLAQGFTVIAERELASFGTVSRRLRIPPALSLEQARDAARALPSGRDADFNHYYRSEQDPTNECDARDCTSELMQGWPYGLPRAVNCGPGGPVGMIDTGINEAHEAFLGAQLELVRLGQEDLDPSREVHGTAVAALLVGQPGSRSPGLLPNSRLVAVDAFHRVGRDERADVFTLLEGFDVLVAAGVSVINLSLAGPANATLENAVRRLVSELDIALVAAVGNAGPSAEPAYPAAYPEVIAVTAVDRTGAIYRRAITGPHVDLAAPGVEVWTAASVNGARWKTGTSFAVPFVTAAAALLRTAQPELAANEVAETMRVSARNLGPPGRDDTYGAGLVQLEPFCRNGQNGRPFTQRE